MDGVRETWFWRGRASFWFDRRRLERGREPWAILVHLHALSRKLTTGDLRRHQPLSGSVLAHPPYSALRCISVCSDLSPSQQGHISLSRNLVPFLSKQFLISACAGCLKVRSANSLLTDSVRRLRASNVDLDMAGGSLAMAGSDAVVTRSGGKCAIKRG